VIQKIKRKNVLCQVFAALWCRLRHENVLFLGRPGCHTGFMIEDQVVERFAAEHAKNHKERMPERPKIHGKTK
jgi:hypothetical protein